VSPTLLAKDGSGIRQDFESDAFVLEPPTPFNPGQITSPGNVSSPQPGDPAPTLTSDKKGPAVVLGQPIAFSSKDDGGDAGALSPTLRAMNHHHSHQNAGGQVAVAFSMRGRDGENMAEPEAGPVSPAIRTGGGDSSKPMVAITQAFNLSPGSGSDGLPSATEAEVAQALTASGQADQNGRGTHIVQPGAQAFKPSHFTRGKDGAPSELAPALTADADKGDQDAILFAPTEGPRPAGELFSGSREGSMVRRLTLVECERLQGFPDNFTLIPWSDARRDAEDFEETFIYLQSHGFGENEARVLASTPDGPRYRVLGNSMAKDVIEALGHKIEKAKALRDGPGAGLEFP
jgi:DNA (cytosine-5)-methyltransferase 1